MCRLFVGADHQLWECKTRSLRIDGMVTSVRLESMFWSTLEDIAARGGVNVPKLLQTLYNECIEEGHDMGNFCSFLRVCCLRYLDLQLRQLIPTDERVSLETLSTEKILELERQSKQKMVSRVPEQKDKTLTLV